MENKFNCDKMFVRKSYFDKIYNYTITPFLPTEKMYLPCTKINNNDEIANWLIKLKLDEIYDNNKIIDVSSVKTVLEHEISDSKFIAEKIKDEIVNHIHNYKNFGYFLEMYKDDN